MDEEVITFNLEKDSVKACEKISPALNDRIQKIVFSAANSAARAGKTVIMRAVTHTLNMATVHGKTPRDRIKGLIRTEYAHDVIHPEATIRISRRPVKLAYFKGMKPADVSPRQQRGMTGSRITVRKGKKETIPHAFVTRLKTGHIGIFRSVRGTRKIIELYGPTTVGVLANNPSVKEQVQTRIAEVFTREVTRRIKLLAEEAKV
ncbi:MAG: phage tail protein [Phycisphaerae bacterium]